MLFRDLIPLLLCFIFLNSYQAVAKNSKSKVIAKVGDIEISSEIFEAHLKENYQNSELIKYSPPMKKRVLDKLIEKILLTLLAEKDPEIASKVSTKERVALNKISAGVVYKQKIFEKLQSEDLKYEYFKKNAPQKAVVFLKIHIRDEPTAKSIHKEMSNKIGELKSNLEAKRLFISYGQKYAKKSFVAHQSITDTTSADTRSDKFALKATETGIMQEIQQDVLGYSIYFIRRILEGEELMRFFNKDLTNQYLAQQLKEGIESMKKNVRIQILDEDLKKIKTR